MLRARFLALRGTSAGLKTQASVPSTTGCAHCDMVLVDEAQFDPVMLALLLRDADVSKVFMGDPRQQIHELHAPAGQHDTRGALCQRAPALRAVGGRTETRLMRGNGSPGASSARGGLLLTAKPAPS
jgi:hypothetical protein